RTPPALCRTRGTSREAARDPDEWPRARPSRRTTASVPASCPARIGGGRLPRGSQATLQGRPCTPGDAGSWAPAEPSGAAALGAASVHLVATTGNLKRIFRYADL